MNEELDLSLPEREEAGQRPRRRGGLLLLVLVAVLANMAVLIVRTRNDGGGSVSRGLEPEARKQLAIKLEKQGLHAVAAAAWKDYLAAAGLEGEQAARIWYRIGTVYQDGEDFEQALASYCRSEAFAELEGLDLELARRTQECLETMGKFAALRHALDERVGIGESAGKAGETVVAEIGAQKITRAELDRRIEAQIERQLAQFASHLPEDKRLRQKEEMLKELSSSSQQLGFLGQFVFEEILYRQARESKLAEDPAVRTMLRDQERSLLAAKVVEKEMADKISITPGDLETWYEAHKSEYMSEPEEEGAEPEQKPFEEVQNEVYRALRAQKAQEVQQALLARLKAQHDVVIHRAAFRQDGAEAERGP